MLQTGLLDDPNIFTFRTFFQNERSEMFRKEHEKRTIQNIGDGIRNPTGGKSEDDPLT